MFLVTTGALQAIPSDVLESARMDGAGPARTLRSITLPLLMISVAPLLISSFAFNFNNFSLIYMLTGGGRPSRAHRSPSGTPTSSSRWSTPWPSRAASSSTAWPARCRS